MFFQTNFILVLHCHLLLTFDSANTNLSFFCEAMFDTVWHDVFRIFFEKKTCYLFLLVVVLLLSLSHSPLERALIENQKYLT